MVNIQSYIGYNADGIKTFYLDAEFDGGYINGMTIESIAIGCEEDYSTTGYPDTSKGNFWEKTYERRTKDWYLYLWSNSTHSGEDVGKFIPTDGEGMFVIPSCEMPEQGMKFCIHDDDWAIKYGWSEEGGNVTATGVDVQLAPAESATGWVSLPAGYYKVTFNAKDLTIRFDDADPEEDHDSYTTEGANPFGDVVKVHEEIPMTEIPIAGDNHLWIIYVKVNYDECSPNELATLPCRDQKTCYIGMMCDYEPAVLLALNLVKTLDDECNIPTQYIGKILELSALKLAIECGDIEKAVYFFTKFFLKNKLKPVHKHKGGCGCHEKRHS